MLAGHIYSPRKVKLIDVPDLPLGDYTVRLFDPLGEGFATTDVAVALAGEGVDLGDIVLETLGVITGEVVDADGAPVGGALVRAVDLPGAALSMFPAAWPMKMVAPCSARRRVCLFCLRSEPCTL